LFVAAISESSGLAWHNCCGPDVERNIAMNGLIVAVAQFLLFLILVAATIFWLFLPRQDKVGLALQAVASLILTVVLIKVAAALYTAALLAASLLIGAARVAAHVHHGQDIVAGVLIAAVAVVIASTIWRWVHPRLPHLTKRPLG